MYEGRVAIVVWGPDAGATGPLRDVADALASAGYVLLVPGSGPASEELCRASFEAGEAPVSLRISGDDADWADIPGLEIQEYPGAIERLKGVLDQADAMVLLPGDISMLAGLMQVWAWGHERDADYRPVLLLGDAWHPIIQALSEAADMNKKTLSMVTFVKDTSEVLDALRYCIAPTS